ncbi:MAG: CvpA family protein, partial [Clostridia bacterium]|nr:CvpA family protein [Clostridia bacterium]
GMYVGNLCANLIVGVVVWIALLLIIKLIFWIIKKLLLKLAKLPVLRVFDRIFGALWSLVIAYVIVVCIVLTVAEIVIIKFGGEGLQNTMIQIVNESTVFKFIHDTNLIGEYIANLFNIDLSSLSVYA